MSVDRISALPDSILGIVLSLLPTNNALATSTLSKRWGFLWRTVHNIDFCLDSYDYNVDQVKNNKFVGLVNHVLLQLDPRVLNKFRLKWRPYVIQSQVTSWINSVITRNVREISLSLECDHAEFEVPISVFSCDSLRSLELDGWITLSASEVFCLPRLENLILYRVFFESDEAFENIIKGCPVLNYLSVNLGENEIDFTYIISSTSLRRLELNVGYSKYLKLDASSLEHLNLYGGISINFVQQKLTSLVEVHFGIDLDSDDDFSKPGICNSMVDALSVFEGTKSLTLSSDVMQTLSCGITSLSTDFKRLVKLTTSISCCQWSSLRDFMQRSNNLEVLTIHKNQLVLTDGSNHDHYSNWTTPVEVPKCLSTSLKKVILDGYYGYDDEREMIGYVLKHGSALKVVDIVFHRDISSWMLEQVEEIFEYPRISDVCNIKFSWMDVNGGRQGVLYPSARRTFLLML